MEFIKKLTHKKYFYLVFFFCLVVLFAFLLHIVLQNDRNSGQPTDDLPRAQATIINSPNAYSIKQNDQIKEMYSNIRVHVELSDNESYEVNLTGQVDKSLSGALDFGSVITVKYHEDDHTAFYYANDPKPRQRVFLYVLLGTLIVAAAGAMLYSSKVLDVLTHRKVMQENLSKMQQEKQQSMDDAARYRGADGTENFGDYSPFGDQDVDYNKLYEENQSLNDAAYNAADTYTGYAEAPAVSPSVPYGRPDTPADPPSDPAVPYTGYGTQTFPATADPDSTVPYAGYEAPNPSTDSAYDPNAPYTGYGMPNPSMDSAYDPNAPYTGYGMPNPSMDSAYDPNAPYTGYGMPNPSMDTMYDPNKPYTG